MDEAHKKGAETRQRFQAARTEAYQEQAKTIKTARLALQRVMESAEATPGANTGGGAAVGGDSVMKISITYLPGEERESDLIFHFVKGLCSGAKVRKSDRHPPYKHVYLTTKKAENPCKSKENA